jgi:hypothetical protein
MIHASLPGTPRSMPGRPCRVLPDDTCCAGYPQQEVTCTAGPIFCDVIGWQADLGIRADFHWEAPEGAGPFEPHEVAGSRRRAFLGGVISSAASTARVAVVGSLVRDEGAGRAGQVLADGGPGAAGTGLDEAHQQQASQVRSTWARMHCSRQW